MDFESNIEKYLYYYGNTSFKELKWNEADCLFFSLLSYVYIKDLNKNVSFGKFCDIALENAPKKRYGRLIPKLYEIVRNHKNDARYRNMRVEHYQYVIDDNTQFGVMALVINNKAFISFAGSDGTVIGWYENIRGSYAYPTYSQKKAREYLSSIINEYESIVLLGHSKGGNLAIAAAMETDPLFSGKIEKILNFDGPGFSKEITHSDKYKRIENKIINYLPEESYIGCLLYHGGTNKIVRTTVKGIDVHFQFNWLLFGGMIEESDGLSEKSNYLHKLTTERWDRLDKNEVQSIMENAFAAFPLDKQSKLKIGVKDVIKAIELNKKNDIVTKKEIKELFTALLSDDDKTN